MAKFMFVFVGSNEPADPDAQANAWNEYVGGLMEKGVVSGGDQFGDVSKVISQGGIVTDSPVSSNGFLILTAADLDEAIEVSKGCPALAANNQVEIHSIIEMAKPS